MRVLSQSASHLVIGRSPWIAWVAALVVFGYGAVQGFAPFLEPSLHCVGERCTLRSNVVDGAESFPRRELAGAVVEAPANRPSVARAVLTLRDERRVFDLQYAPHGVVAQQVDAIDRYVQRRDDTLHLGPVPDLRRALSMFFVFALAAAMIAFSGRGLRLTFDAGAGVLRIGRSRTVPLSEVRLREHRDTEWVLFLELPGGERLDLDRVLVQRRPDKHELKQAIEAILRQS